MYVRKYVGGSMYALKNRELSNGRARLPPPGAI